MYDDRWNSYWVPMVVVVAALACTCLYCDMENFAADTRIDEDEQGNQVY
jgi:hypothetical protein